MNLCGNNSNLIGGKMKVVQINAVCSNGSTGKICVDISKLLTEKGIENYIFYSQGTSNYPLGIKYTDDRDLKIQALKSRVLGNFGFNSQRATKKLVKELERINPDIVHLHNIHSQNVNLEILFDYLRKTQVKVFWSFHDCWAFTGYCTHYEMAECDKWKTGCDNCVQKKSYSWFFDRSKKFYEKKKAIFDGVNITILSPTFWMTNAIQESFLKNKDFKIIEYAIDADLFHPSESNFREKYNLQNKKIVLGVAFGWGPKKGLDAFIELSKKLPEDYQIILVGTNDEVDKQLPSNIISIHRTYNQSELAEIYSAADVFVNCTRQETFGLVNIEALACGTPIITFKSGGSPEAVDENCGSVVEKNDIEALQKEVVRICEEKPYSSEACRKRVIDKFESKDICRRHLEAYIETLNNN